MTLSVQPHSIRDLDRLAAFLKRYLAVIPDAKLAAPELYTYHPAAEDGRNVLCAVDETGSILGFSPLFPAPVAPDNTESPDLIWTIVAVSPGLPDGDQVREMLFSALLSRARELAECFPVPHRVRLSSDYMVSQREDIAFLISKGFVRDQEAYVMQRALGGALSDFPLPAGVTVRRWRMETEAEQDQYLAAFNRCFPNNPKDRAALQFFMQSPHWAEGTAIAAFTPDNALVASVLSYWNPEDRIGISDDVFVAPDWRGRGLARFLVNAGLEHLRGRGIMQARLEVLKHNTPAVRVYLATGHEIVNEEILLGLDIR